MTARKDVSTSAPAEPRKTAKGDCVSVAKANVASCVLSPNSARNMIPKVVNSVLTSISLTPFFRTATGYTYPVALWPFCVTDNESFRCLWEVHLRSLLMAEVNKRVTSSFRPAASKEGTLHFQ